MYLNNAIIISACCILFGAISSAATVCFHQEGPSYNDHDICVHKREKAIDTTLDKIDTRNEKYYHEV